MGNLSVVEAVWILVNTITLAYVLNALSDALAAREAVTALDAEPSRKLVVAGDVRNERSRFVKVLLLMVVAVPGVFYADGEVRPLVVRTVPAVALMALALVLLWQSYKDARQRKRLLVLVTAEALELKADALARIEAKVDHGTEVAERAYDAANHTKERFDVVTDAIAAQGLIQAAQGDEMASQREERKVSDAALTASVEDTQGMVGDLHAGTAPEKAG